MKICIIGWYGTETMGDRSILAGIFSIFNSCFLSCEVSIGSLYPFLTDRTLIEDGDIYHELAPHMSLRIFCSKDKTALHDNVMNSDLTLMGGGPIMDLNELEIIAYAFKKAQYYKKKTMLIGCGIGPLYNKQFINIVKTILQKTNCAVFRDKNSLDFANRLLDVQETQDFSYANDPAIIPIKYFIETHKQVKQDRISINFRSFPRSSYQYDSCFNERIITKIIDGVAQLYKYIDLIPMHTFCIGGDDRKYLTELKTQTTCDNVRVIHHPMNLFELFELFYNSEGCIGMRYHSIVLQTLLNGNNIVFDYTDKRTGKIQSFLQMIDKNNFYNDRYWCMQDETGTHDIIDRVVSSLQSGKCFTYNIDIFDNTSNTYINHIKKTLEIF